MSKLLVHNLSKTLMRSAASSRLVIPLAKAVGTKVQVVCRPSLLPPSLHRHAMAGLATMASVSSPHATTTTATTTTTKKRSHGGLWSKELEPHPEILPASQIVNPATIQAAIEKTKIAAKDPYRVHEILEKAIDKAFLRKPKTGKLEPIPSDDPQHEFVLGLDLEEAATLLNLVRFMRCDADCCVYFFVSHAILTIQPRMFVSMFTSMRGFRILSHNQIC